MSPSPTTAPVISQPPWEALFDGTPNTSAWESLGPFLVRDGLLIATGGGTNAISKEDYADFELEAEWKIGPQGNSGIYYREPPTSKIGEGNEYQMLDDAAYADKQPPLMQTGSLYGLIAPSPVARPIGEWNQTRILCRGTQAEHWLNDRRVVQYDTAGTDWQQRVAASTFAGKDKVAQRLTGRILLQGHTGEIPFRRIQIRRLWETVPQQSTASTSPSYIQAISELNQGDYNTAPWPSRDGLRLYWEGKTNGEVQILSAARADVRHHFSTLDQRVAGSPGDAFAPDELEVICVGSGISAKIQVRRRGAIGEPFSTFVPLSLPNDPGGHKSPSLSADGLHLVFQGGEQGSIEFFTMSGRQVKAAQGAATSLAGMHERDHGIFITWPYLSDDDCDWVRTWRQSGDADLDRDTKFSDGTVSESPTRFSERRTADRPGAAILPRTRRVVFQSADGRRRLGVGSGEELHPTGGAPAVAALSFDGVDDHVVIDSLNLADYPPDQPLTIEATVRPTNPRIGNVLSWLGTTGSPCTRWTGSGGWAGCWSGRTSCRPPNRRS